MCRTTDIRDVSIRDVTFVLTAIILMIAISIIYLKRHIERMRFQISAVAGVPYARGVYKGMVDEIEECLSIVATIRKEPRLLLGRSGEVAPVAGSDIVYRMKTIDAMKQLDAAVAEATPSLKRRPFGDVRRHLCDPRMTSGPLKLASLDIINDFLSLYEHARFDPGYYGPDKFDEYNELFKQLLYSVNSHSGNVMKTSGSIGSAGIGVVGAVSLSQRASSSGTGTGGSITGLPATEVVGGVDERLLQLSSAVRRPLLADSEA